MLCSVSRASAGLTTEYLIVSSKPPTGYYVDGVTECSVSRASAGFTEYLRVSSKPPTGYYVDGVTECSVSRASAGFTEYLIMANLDARDCLDERLSKEMQMMDEETLTEQKAVSMIRQAECVDKQSSELRSASRTENVHSVQGNSYAKKGNAKKP